MSYLKRSPWILHYDATSCNGCDIEVLACLTPVYDVERLGIINTGNPKHADILLITGSVNEQNRDVIQNLYDQMPDPKVVVAIGICATSGGIFAECYNVGGGIDKFIPVDVYVPGCAARPEQIIDGVIRSLKVLEEKYIRLKRMKSGIEHMKIEIAHPENAPEILALQKLAYQSEAEIYQDFFLHPLTQTLDELKQDFQDKLFLKAVIQNEIVGSVRGYKVGDSCDIGRLIVKPAYQNLGIGKKLMLEIENHFPECNRFELFTGHKSRRNIYFYQKLGYRIFKSEEVSSKRRRVFMQKWTHGEKND
jgi:ech hydrogenase subunit C